MERVEVAVLGVGGVGSAALYSLARRGVRALGIDRFPPGHDRGSSHGDTRLIRLAYFEGPRYVPLLRASFTLWEALAEACGERLYEEVGILQVGPAEGSVMRGIDASVEQFDLAIDRLDRGDLPRGFTLPEGSVAIFDRRAGFLRVEDCVRAHVARAQAEGARLRLGDAVLGWEPDGGGVRVLLDRGEAVLADRLVITAGPWASDLLMGLGLPLQVTRQPLFWFSSEPTYAAAAGAPGFLYDLGAGGVFYGFPSVDARGVKVAQHHGGRPVTDPLSLDRSLDPAEEAKVAAFLRGCLPGAAGRRTHHAVCMYTNTPDEDFVVDRHPLHPQVVFAAGLSGHGFKLATVLGEVLADLVLEGRTEQPIDFLRAGRFG